MCPIRAVASNDTYRTQRSSSCRPLVALPMPQNPCFCLMSTQWSFYMKWSPQKTHGLLRQRCQRLWEGERVWGMLISSLHVILHRFISQCHQARAGDKAGSAGKKHNISCWQVESLFTGKTQRLSGQTAETMNTPGKKAGHKRQWLSCIHTTAAQKTQWGRKHLIW